MPDTTEQVSAPAPAEPRRRPYTKTEQVLTTLTETDRQRLDDYAEGRLMSRADAVRGFILTGLDDAEDSVL